MPSSSSDDDADVGALCGDDSCARVVARALLQEGSYERSHYILAEGFIPGAAVLLCANTLPNFLEGYLRPRWSVLCSDAFRSSVGA